MGHTGDKPPPDVDSLIGALRGDERAAASAKQFTVDAEQARKQLKSRLPDPHGYILLLIRAAVRLGASDMEVSIRKRLLELRFAGVSLGPETLQGVMKAPFSSTGQTPDPGLPELGLGLGVALGADLGVRSIEGTSRGAGASRGARLSLAPDGTDRCEATPHAEDRTHIRIEGAILSRGPRPEEALVRRRCQHAGIPIRLNGELISHGLDLTDAIATLPVAGDPNSGEAGFLPLAGDESSVRFVKDGVWLATHSLDAGGYGFVAVVDAGGLKVDLSESDVVRNEKYDALIQAVCDTHAAALAQYDVAALAKPKLHAHADQQLWALQRSIFWWRVLQIGVRGAVIYGPIFALFYALAHLIQGSFMAVGFGVLMLTGIVGYVLSLLPPFNADPVGRYLERRYSGTFPPGGRLRQTAFELEAEAEQRDPWWCLSGMMRRYRKSGVEVLSEDLDDELRPARPWTNHQRDASQERRQRRLDEKLVKVCDESFASERLLARQLLEQGASPDAKDSRGDTALVVACKRSDRDLLALLLKRGADPSLAGHYDETPLMKACETEDLRVMRLLLDAGADLAARDWKGLDVLVRVAGRDKPQILELLIKAGVDVNARTERGRTALMRAAEKGKYRMVELLLKAGADPRAMDDKGRTSLDFALAADRRIPVTQLEAALAGSGGGQRLAELKRQEELDLKLLKLVRRSGAVSKIKAVLDNGADPNACTWRGSALCEAIANEHGAAVATLLAAGAKVDERDHWGTPALINAIERRHPALAAQLMEAGADLNARDPNRNNPLMVALDRGHAALAHRLLERAVDLDAAAKDGRTALMVAVRHHDDESVQRLLEAGADRTARDSSGQSALDLAQTAHEPVCIALLEHASVQDIDPAQLAELRRVKQLNERLIRGEYMSWNVPGELDRDVVELLLEQGAQVTARDAKGEFALTNVARAGHTDLVALLLDHGAEVNAQAGWRRESALFKAVEGGHLQTAALLLERGADPDLANERGVYPMALAAAGGHAPLVELLLKAGVHPETSDRNGLTLLMAAARHGDADCVALLLQAGARAEAQDDDKMTALDHARERGNEAAQAVLEQCVPTSRPVD